MTKLWTHKRIGVYVEHPIKTIGITLCCLKHSIEHITMHNSKVQRSK